MNDEIDYLVLAAHPDDAELYCGGTLIKLRDLGYKVGILDFTRGESGTVGTVEDRDRETIRANSILKPAFRQNLGLPDGRLLDDANTREQVVDIIRQFRVKMLIAPLAPCRHPDHSVVHQVARAVHFFSGAGKFPSAYSPWRPLRVMYHLEFNDFKPSFVIDISSQFDDKMRCIESYSSQFYTDSNHDEKTFVGSRRFREYMIARFRYYGNLIDCDYGEPYVVDETLRIDDPLKAITGA